MSDYHKCIHTLLTCIFFLTGSILTRKGASTVKKGRTDSSSVTTTEKPTGRISRQKTTTGAASILKDVG